MWWWWSNKLRGQMNKSNSNLALVILVVMIQLSVGDLVVVMIQQLSAI